jgi:hypothetical protein
MLVVEQGAAIAVIGRIIEILDIFSNFSTE